MHQEFDEAVRADPEMWPVVQEAARLLDEESEGTFLPARARWYYGERTHNQSSPGPLLVEVEDQTGLTRKQLYFADLVHPRERRHAMNWLWGDVLANRSDRLMRRRLAAEGAT